MKTATIGFIGGGRITKIFLQAFSNKNVKFERVLVYDTRDEAVHALTASFPWVEYGDLETVARQPFVIIALHPPVIMETLDLVAGNIAKDASILSLAPKITIGQIASRVGTNNVVRLIPNATSWINEGYNPVCFAQNFDPEEKVLTLELLKLLGKTFETEEQKLEAYALMSAMLPTYFWFQWLELCDLGIKMGLSEQESRESVQFTLKAAVDSMFGSGLPPENLMDLIPVKPIGDCEDQITDIYRTKLMALYARIKPS